MSAGLRKSTSLTESGAVESSPVVVGQTLWVLGGMSGSGASLAAGTGPLATGSDIGGSIRIPGAFTGLPGLKNTYGRIPKAPRVAIGSLTSVTGCLSRSVRDIARFLDVTKAVDHWKASGVDLALKSLAEAPFGKLLLGDTEFLRITTQNALNRLGERAVPAGTLAPHTLALVEALAGSVRAWTSASSPSPSRAPRTTTS